MKTLAPPPFQAENFSHPRHHRSTVSLICHCLGITESSVRDCIALLSEPTLEAVLDLSGAGAGCSGCHRRIERILTGESPSACNRFSLCETCGSCRAICACSSADESSGSLLSCGGRR